MGEFVTEGRIPAIHMSTMFSGLLQVMTAQDQATNGDQDFGRTSQLVCGSPLGRALLNRVAWCLRGDLHTLPNQDCNRHGWVKMSNV